MNTLYGIFWTISAIIVTFALVAVVDSTEQVRTTRKVDEYRYPRHLLLVGYALTVMLIATILFNISIALSFFGFTP